MDKPTEYHPSAVCNCNVGETCFLHDETKKVSKTTKKVKPMKKQTKKVSAKEFVAGITAPFPYKRSDLDVIVTMGVGKSKKVPRVTVRLIKKNEYQKCLWEGNATVAEVEAFKDDEALMDFVKSKVGAILPDEISHNFNKVTMLVTPGIQLNLTLDTNENYFTLKFFSKKSSKVTWKETVCAGSYDSDDHGIKDLVDNLYSKPSDMAAQDFLFAAFNDENNEILATNQNMKNVLKCAQKFASKNPGSSIYSALSQPGWNNSIATRYIVGRMIDSMDSFGDSITFSRRTLEAAVIPSFIMSLDEVNVWLNNNLFLDLLRVVIAAFYDDYRVDMKRDQDLRPLISKRSAHKLEFKVDDLISITRVDDSEIYVLLEDVIDRVNNGRF